MPGAAQAVASPKEKLSSPRHDAGNIVEVDALRKVFPKRKKARGPFSFLRGRSASEESDTFVAVDGVSFAIRKGEVFGLLGPNGAGKTTTIRMLSTLLEPTSGRVSIGGYDALKQPDLVRQSLGAVLTGERSVYWKLTGRENLAYFAALYHLPPKVAKARVDELLVRMNLEGRADEYVERYSSGMKQRVAIAKALLADPPLLLLDEPTIGLDPQSARNLRELILEIKAEGRTVLLTTHYMEEADGLCDRIGIVDAGKIIALDTPANLKKLIRQLDVVQLELDAFDPTLEPTLRALPTVEQLVVTVQGGTTTLALHTTDGRGTLPGLIDLLTQSGSRLSHIGVVEPTLEDVFITLTGKALRE